MFQFCFALTLFLVIYFVRYNLRSDWLYFQPRSQALSSAFLVGERAWEQHWATFKARLFRNTREVLFMPHCKEQKIVCSCHVTITSSKSLPL